MKKLNILLVLLCLYYPNFAQKFHLVMVGDTADESIGVSCDRDIDRISSEANTIARSIGYTLNRVIIKDDKFDPTVLKNAIKSIVCGKEDIIYFHYSGHGKRNENTETYWPDLDFKEKGALPLSKINDLIGAKSARLKLIVADCCNQFSGTVVPVTFQAIPTLSATDAQNNRKKLFAEASHFIVSSGSQPGQFSYGTYEDGGYFTNSLLEALQYSIVATNSASWESIFKDAQRRTQAKAYKNYKKQIPQFEIGESAAQGKTGKPTTAPQNAASAKDNKQTDLLEINTFLNSLLDAQIADKEKQKIIKGFTKYFLPKARVDIYKNTTLVDRELIEDFLNRIYLESKQIQHINLIENACKLKGDKYEMITIQEIRN